MDSATIALAEELKSKQLERANRNRPITKKQLVAAMRQTILRVEAQRMHGTELFSFSRAIRGMLALKGEVIESKSVEQDIEYTRALSSGTQPGSFLTPTLQSNQIISQLQQYSVARAAGATIWPMEKVLEMTVPSGVTAPTVLWQAQNSKQTPDAAANFGQLSFTLKSQTALLLIPLQLLRTSKPVFDQILADSFALACAESEDSALFASSTQSGAPTALLSAAGITTINTGGSANGGNLALSDILGMLLKASQLKMRAPYCWFTSSRSLFTRLLGLQDTSSRPLLLPDLSGAANSGYSLLGHPVFVTTSISETEALGSGSNQSHLVLCTPRSIHVAQDKDVSMAISLDGQYFDSAQAGLRIGNQIDFGYAPAASLICLLGIN